MPGVSQVGRSGASALVQRSNTAEHVPARGEEQPSPEHTDTSALDPTSTKIRESQQLGMIKMNMIVCLLSQAILLFLDIY